MNITREQLERLIEIAENATFSAYYDAMHSSVYRIDRVEYCRRERDFVREIKAREGIYP